ncbi:hypothetical protein Efla_006964 [Eimeria flavescens]
MEGCGWRPPPRRLRPPTCAGFAPRRAARQPVAPITRAIRSKSTCCVRRALLPASSFKTSQQLSRFEGERSVGGIRQIHSEDSTGSASTAANGIGNDDLSAPEGITDDLFWVDRMQPTRCSGCGVPLQTEEEAALGYVPKAKLAEFAGKQRNSQSCSISWLKAFNDGLHVGPLGVELCRDRCAVGGRSKRLPRPRGEEVEAVPDGVEVMQMTSPKFRLRTRLLTCQRCFRMQQYRSVDGRWESQAVQAAGALPSLSASSVVKQLTRVMPKNSIILKIVDICDLELSVVPELFQACREKGLKTLWIINRVDCLPRNVDLQEVKQWVRRMVRQIRNVHVDDCILVSSATGFGFDTLESRIGEILAQDEEASEGRFMFVAGRVNAGKSTFVNRFLKFVGYKHFGTLFLSRAVGGSTRSALPGTTLDLIPFGLPKGFKLIDTPGVPSGSQASGITNMLPFAADLFSIVPTKRLQPVTYALTEGKTLLVGAMARFDLIQGSAALCTCYFSHKVTLHISKTSRAEDLLRRKACAFLYPPHLPEGFERLQPLVRHRVEVYGGRRLAYDDISVGGLGWISVSGTGLKVFDVWVPKGVKIFRRPAMLPKQIQETGVDKFTGKSPRARGPRISARKRALAEQMKEAEMQKRNSNQTAERQLPDAEAPLVSAVEGVDSWFPGFAQDEEDELHGQKEQAE